MSSFIEGRYRLIPQIWLRRRLLLIFLIFLLDLDKVSESIDGSVVSLRF